MSNKETLNPREQLNLKVKQEIGDGLVCQAFRQVDRADFTPDEFRQNAYRDEIIELGIYGRGVSLSQPVLVAQMIDGLSLKGGERILEVGAGTGYAAAILAHCNPEAVDAVEHNQLLVESSRERLKQLGLIKIRINQGDGALGLPQFAPYDAILVSAGAREIPRALGDQLAEGGRMVIPVGKNLDSVQDLITVTKSGKQFSVEKIFQVRFHYLYSLAHGGWTLEQIINAQKERVSGGL